MPVQSNAWWHSMQDLSSKICAEISTSLSGIQLMKGKIAAMYTTPSQAISRTKSHFKDLQEYIAFSKWIQTNMAVAAVDILLLVWLFQTYCYSTGSVARASHRKVMKIPKWKKEDYCAISCQDHTR